MNISRGIAVLGIATVGCLSQGGSGKAPPPPGNPQLGIAEFKITETATELHIAGVDAKGNVVGHIDVERGKISLPPEGNEGTAADVVGRKFTIDVLGTTGEYQGGGIENPLNLPAAPAGPVSTFLHDSHVEPVLARWGINFKKSQLNATPPKGAPPRNNTNQPPAHLPSADVRSAAAASAAGGEVSYTLGGIYASSTVNGLFSGYVEGSGNVTKPICYTSGSVACGSPISVVGQPVSCPSGCGSGATMRINGVGAGTGTNICNGLPFTDARAITSSTAYGDKPNETIVTMLCSVGQGSQQSPQGFLAMKTCNALPGKDGNGNFNSDCGASTNMCQPCTAWTTTAGTYWAPYGGFYSATWTGGGYVGWSVSTIALPYYSECHDGTSCYAGSCVTLGSDYSACECVAPGSVCRDNADCCYSSTCTGGICTAQTCSPDGDYCDTSDSGPGCCGGCNYEGSYCNGSYYYGSCQGTTESYGYCANEGGLSETGVTGTNPTGAYVSCSSGSGCYSGTCNAGECAGVEAGYSCRGNFDCVHGSTCVSGTCSAQTCIADGQYCDDYSASCCGTCNDTGVGYDYYCDNYYYGSCTSWGYYTYNYGTCGCDGGCPDTGVVPANPLKVANATCSSNSQCYSQHCITPSGGGQTKCECAAPGSSCQNSNDCCTGSTCSGGMCQAQTCRADGQFCASDYDSNCCGTCNYTGQNCWCADYDYYCCGSYYYGNCSQWCGTGNCLATQCDNTGTCGCDTGSLCPDTGVTVHR